ncbi:MAG: hypothetical protein HZB50_09885 [Chloroflexi bacterium]|nr:hypothetical protein [Chloroflexota bacterium]
MEENMLKQKLLMIALFLAFLSGCSIVRQHILGTSTSTPIDIEFTSIPTFAPPSITPVFTPVPAQPASAQTPFPTLTSNEAKTKLFNLLVNNGGCNLPCLIGYSPRISTRQDLQGFFNQFRVADTPDLSVTRSVATDGSSIGFFIRYTNNYLNMGISTYENKNQIEALGMGTFSQPNWDTYYAETMKYYMLPQILTNYGEPSQVLILTYRNDRQRPDVTTFPFFLVLLYPERGFYVKYEMDRISTGAKFLGCPSKSFVDIVVWSPGDEEVFEKTVKPTINGEYFGDYKSLDKATIMTVEEFYKVFSDPESMECIETSIETWPNP